MRKWMMSSLTVAILADAGVASRLGGERGDREREATARRAFLGRH